MSIALTGTFDADIALTGTFDTSAALAGTVGVYTPQEIVEIAAGMPMGLLLILTYASGV